MAVLRNTRQRAAIREAFETCGCPLSPEDVLASARRLTEGVGIATVYRSIKALMEEGWLVAVELPGQTPRYELAGKGHHHHFHCNGCGRVFELKGCVEGFRKMIPRGFQVTGHEVLLSGLCSTCRTAGN
jgi:Fur family transcriptional regulator, ferric uptake regulator